MKSSAKLSKCRNYRYSLSRIWDDTKDYAVFIGLNPSTADESNDDPTLRRCMKFAQDWGYGGVFMVNLFAFRATDPNAMMKASDPIGSYNDQYLLEVTDGAGIIVAAWGNDGSFLSRSSYVKKMIKNLRCLKMNKTGEPAHPLYQPKSAVPIGME